MTWHTMFTMVKVYFISFEISFLTRHVVEFFNFFNLIMINQNHGMIFPLMFDHDRSSRFIFNSLLKLKNPYYIVSITRIFSRQTVFPLIISRQGPCSLSFSSLLILPLTAAANANHDNLRPRRR